MKLKLRRLDAVVMMFACLVVAAGTSQSQDTGLVATELKNDFVQATYLFSTEQSGDGKISYHPDGTATADWARFGKDTGF